MTTPHAHPGTVRIHAAGAGGLLLDAACGAAFDDGVQQRIWALGVTLSAAAQPAIREVVPGVNNLLLVFDPLVLHPADARVQLQTAWNATTVGQRAGRDVEIPVVYGGAPGEDLQAVAQAAHMPVVEFVRRHSEAAYAVSCIGAMPGFAYLSGLPPELAQPRRAVPRTRIAKGSVILGGGQAGVMPCDAPSGWHLLGHTETDLFDASRAAPCLLAPGDRVRFRVLGIAA